LIKEKSDVVDYLQPLINDEHPDCLPENGCMMVKKMKAIFPLTGSEFLIDSVMNQFSYKYIYLYTDKMTVYGTDGA